MKKSVLMKSAIALSVAFLGASKVQAKSGDILFEGEVAYSNDHVWVKFNQPVKSFYGLRAELSLSIGSLDHLCEYQVDGISVPTEQDYLKMKQTANFEWRGNDFNPIKPANNGVFVKFSMFGASPVPPPLSRKTCKLTLKQSDGMIVPGRPPAKPEKVVTINTSTEVRVIYSGSTAAKIYDLMKGADTAKVSDGNLVTVSSRQLNLAPRFSLLCNRTAFASPVTAGVSNECTLEVNTDRAQTDDAILIRLKAGTAGNAQTLKVFGLKVDADLASQLFITEGVSLQSNGLDLLLSVSRSKIGPVGQDVQKERTYTGEEASGLYDRMEVEAVPVSAMGVGFPPSGDSKRFAFDNFSLVCLRDRNDAQTDCTATLKGARKVISPNLNGPAIWKIDLAKEHGQYIVQHYSSMTNTQSGVSAQFADGLKFTCDSAADLHAVSNCNVKLEINK